jgi:hypothetical protein
MIGRLLMPAWLVLGTLLGASLPPQDLTAAAPSQIARHSPYLGQPLPALSPERFAPGVVSTDAIELNGVFTPDLTEFFFARLIDGVQTMHHSVLVDGAWSAPRPLVLFPGESRAVADDMTVSPDGRELYFLGIHPHPRAAGVPSTDIWRSRRIDGKWSTAEVKATPISTEAGEVVLARGDCRRRVLGRCEDSGTVQAMTNTTRAGAAEPGCSLLSLHRVGPSDRAHRVRLTRRPPARAANPHGLRLADAAGAIWTRSALRKSVA